MEVLYFPFTLVAAFLMVRPLWFEYRERPPSVIVIVPSAISWMKEFYLAASRPVFPTQPGERGPCIAPPPLSLSELLALFCLQINLRINCIGVEGIDFAFGLWKDPFSLLHGRNTPILYHAVTLRTRAHNKGRYLLDYIRQPTPRVNFLESIKNSQNGGTVISRKPQGHVRAWYNCGGVATLFSLSQMVLIPASS